MSLSDTQIFEILGEPILKRGPTERQFVKLDAYKNFLKHMDLAIEAMYLCNMESNGAVLSMPIKELYEELNKP
jgi:hypothetical protein